VKILYISQYFPPEIAAPAARVSELSRQWVKSGHEVTVLTGFPNYPTGIIPKEYQRKLRRLLIKEEFEGMKVFRTWLWPQPHRGAIKRIFSFISFFLSASISGLLISRPDIVIATSPPLLVGLTGWWLARAKRVPFIFEIRDLWPESLEAVGIADAKSLLHRILVRVASFLYRTSDRIVVVTPAFKNFLVEKWQLSDDKSSVIQNGVETDLLRPDLETSALRKQLGVEDKFVVCYAGTIGMAHGLETLVQTAQQLQHSHPNILFWLIGDGAEKENVMSQARSLRLSNLQVLGPQPREKVPQYICASNACLVMLKPVPLFKTVIPTKMLEAMACARPVILGVDGQARKILEEAQAGIFVRPGSADELGRTVVQLAVDASLRERLGNNGRRYILQRLTRKQTAHDYVKVLQSHCLPDPDESKL